MNWPFNVWNVFEFEFRRSLTDPGEVSEGEDQELPAQDGGIRRGQQRIAADGDEEEEEKEAG